MLLSTKITIVCFFFLEFYPQPELHCSPGGYLSEMVFTPQTHMHEMVIFQCCFINKSFNINYLCIYFFFYCFRSIHSTRNSRRNLQG